MRHGDVLITHLVHASGIYIAGEESLLPLTAELLQDSGHSDHFAAGFFFPAMSLSIADPSLRERVPSFLALVIHTTYSFLSVKDNLSKKCDATLLRCSSFAKSAGGCTVLLSVSTPEPASTVSRTAALFSTTVLSSFLSRNAVHTWSSATERTVS